MYPCSSEINWLIPLFPQILFSYIPCSLILSLFPSKFGLSILCSPEINDIFPCSPKLLQMPHMNLTDRPGHWAQQSIIHENWIYRFRVHLDKIATPKWLGPVEQSVVSSIADTGIVRSIQAQYFRGGWSWNIFYRHSPSFSDFFIDSRNDIVSNKRKRVHKVLPSLSIVTKEPLYSSPCKPGVVCLISGFTSLSDENLSCGPVSIWP